jgi:hypothetical protein
VASLGALQHQHRFALVFTRLTPGLFRLFREPDGNALDLCQTGHSALQVAFEISDALLRHADRVFKRVDEIVGFGLTNLKQPLKNAHTKTSPILKPLLLIKDHQFSREFG